MLSPEGADCPGTSQLLPILTSIASLLGCFYVVGTYWRIVALRQHPAGVMFGMSLYGAIYQFLYLLDQVSSSVHCTDTGILVDFLLTGQETYMLIFAIDLLLVLKNPFSASKGQMTKYHILGGLWSLMCAIISHFDTRYALFSFCWLSSRVHVDENGPKRASKTLSTGFFFAFYIVVVYCTSLIAIVRTWNTFVQGLPDTFRTRQRIQRHLKYYVGCYFGYWTVVLACYAVFSFLPRGDKKNAKDPGELRCRIWHLLSCLLLAKGLVHAVIWTRTSNILCLFETDGTPTQGGDDNINWALRLEIVTNTAKGICQSVDRAEAQARVSRELHPTSLSADVGPLEAGTLDSPVDYCDRKESYTQIEELVLETRNENRALGPRTQGVVFQDFAPHVFRRLRERASISSATYRTSLQQTTKERVSEGKSGAFFYFTEDRKYVVKTLTHDELNFLLSILPQYYTYMKTHPETFMTRFFGCHGLTMYGKTVFFVVMQSVFANSLPIHERFDLKGSWVGRLEGRKPTGTRATCKYCNREYLIGGSHDQRCPVREGNCTHAYDQVGKDLNWHRHMALPYATARAVAMQLKTDSEFLCSINCIDYSLLVGIHHRSFHVSHASEATDFIQPNNQDCRRYPRGSNQRTPPLHHHGGISVDEVHGPGVYYFGLIDILQEWNFRKRVEHFFRVYVLCQDRHGISVTNPRQYADRFQQRVIKELIYDAAVKPQREDHVREYSLTQLQLQNERNAQLIESTRTLSTMLASLDSSRVTYTSRPSVRIDAVTHMMVSPDRDMRLSGKSRKMPPPFCDISHHSFCSCDRSSCGSSLGSMELPGTGVNLSMVYPTSFETLPLHLRRVLAPITPSPQTLSIYQDEYDYTKPSYEKFAGSSYAEAGLYPCTSVSPDSYTTNRGPLDEGAVRDASPPEYQIVCTPMYPAKRSRTATLSA
ncbi:hypothetical protein PsorP6_010344 [Peronosclerospora sorghi]|uniref:Uncharacterized protein n=1 Tax=Peronosclerospora sorghi TaxID=230839 RepID=A0ACC0VVT1_9STRA|nr:hypothetical protein PsorP6_010344 [Peronosclerospora sorghi]